jgi:aspartyl-tRNA(Asn)/glutamyl-tRNA(Gln) amidotransferase subunit A
LSTATPQRESTAVSRERELCFLGASELTRLYRARALSPLEVTRAQLSRIARLQPILNAFVFVDEHAALEQAREAEQRYQRGAALGPLDGVGVSLKDLLLARGWPTRYGSRTVDERGPWLEDSPAAARLREAGLVLLGKTTTSEFGLKGMGDSPLTGTTRNPWDVTRTPGGSSAGAVSATAAGLNTIAVGTDGGGSIRVPASFSGVVGLKPNFGRVPTFPSAVVGAPAHVGPIARNVRDAALLLQVLSGSDHRDPYRLPPGTLGQLAAVDLSRLRIGYSVHLFPAELAPDHRAVFERAVHAFRELGAHVEPLSDRLESPSPILTTLFQARAAFTVKDLDTQQRSLLDPAIEEAARAGERLSLLDYLSAERARTELAQRIAALQTSFDLLLTPTTAEAAPSVAAAPSPTRAPFTGAFSLTRQPAISVPSGRDRDGLPLGIQLVARPFDEHVVLRAAAAFEELLPAEAAPEPGA